MKAYQCDRCGEFYSDNDLPPYIPDIVPSFRSGCKLDLCPSCIDHFNTWLHTEFYFADQVKRGHGFPCVVQECRKCKHWIFKDDIGFVCDFGWKWRPTSLICKKWTPAEK